MKHLSITTVLVIGLMLKIWLSKFYFDLVSFLSESVYLWPTIGLRKILGKMDLQRAMIDPRKSIFPA